MNREIEKHLKPDTPSYVRTIVERAFAMDEEEIRSQLLSHLQGQELSWVSQFASRGSSDVIVYGDRYR